MNRNSHQHTVLKAQQYMIGQHIGHPYVQTYTKNNKTSTLLQTTGGKDEPNIPPVACRRARVLFTLFVFAYT